MAKIDLQIIHQNIDKILSYESEKTSTDLFGNVSAPAIDKDFAAMVTEIFDALDEAYYVFDAPLVDDATYDRIKRIAEKFNIKYLQKKVGATAKKGFKKIKHLAPMLSISNVFNEGDLQAFIDRIEKELHKKIGEDFEIVAEPKIDGIGFSALYENGILTKCATRGDGEIGEDITENIRTIKNIPLQIDLQKFPTFPKKIEIRGEVYMDKKDFLKMNEAQEDAGKKIFANPRNASAGSLRQIDSSITATRPLKLLAYTCALPDGDENPFASQWEFLSTMREVGFPTAFDYDLIRLCKSTPDIINYFNDIYEIRSRIPFDIDGLVYKINSIKLQDEMGFIARAPRWEVAHKFPADTAMTKLLGITLQVGRTGTITPVAELEPIGIGGVLVKRATLHNQDEITRKDIRIGDTITVVRSGDVIPKITAVISEKREANSQAFSIEKMLNGRCPSCGSTIAKDDDKVALYCTNKISCPAQIQASLQYFANIVGMDGLGEKQIELFYNRGWLKNSTDIFRLKTHEAELKKIDGYGEKSISNLLASIEAHRKIPFDKFICALGINGIGEANSYTLASTFGNIESLKHAEISDLTNIFGIGEVMAIDIVKFFRNEKELKKLDELLREITIENFESSSDAVDQTNPFYKKIVVFTGTLNSMGRKDAEEKIRKLGGTATASVSSKTDFVVWGQSAGSTLAKAEKLGIKTLSEEEFLKMLG